MLHHSGIFAQDSDYVFAAEMQLEQLQVESQIDMSMRKGKIVDNNGEKKIINNSNFALNFQTVSKLEKK